MTVVIMQPYFFPYLGYFQLVEAADHFVFYDDVDFIKGGWINRNRISINGQDKTITIPLIKSSTNKKINQTKIFQNNKDIRKILKSIKFEYAKSPFFENIFPIIEKLFSDNHDSIANLAGESVIKTSEYLKMDTKFYYSSKYSPETANLSRSERLIEITKKLNSTHYINIIGGKDLYTKDQFNQAGIKLSFLNPVINQKDRLSIIDVLMNNDINSVKNKLTKYELT